MNLVQIAHISNGFTDKFGIPRQSREESVIESRIIFEPTFRVREALRGIDAYSHLWLIWAFHNLNNQPEASGHNLNDQPEANSTSGAPSSSDAGSTSGHTWSPTVRPPRLGGNTRMGVFATRSPYRPNPLGLTSVRLLRVEETPHDGLTLVVSGADLLDGTPIYDIKPYLSFSDSHPQAINGFADATRNYRLKVVGLDKWETSMTSEASKASETSKASKTSKTSEASEASKASKASEASKARLLAELEEILSQDPRPAYQDDRARVYKLDYACAHVEFHVDGDTLYVDKITQDKA